MKQLNLITGVLLPIWGKLPTSNNKVFRVKEDNGKSHLGVMIENAHLSNFLKELNGKNQINLSYEELAENVLHGGEVKFTNDYKIKGRLVMGDTRMEIMPRVNEVFSQDEKDELIHHCNAFTEIINYQIRAFLQPALLNNAIKYLDKTYGLK